MMDEAASEDHEVVLDLGQAASSDLSSLLVAWPQAPAILLALQNETSDLNVVLSNAVPAIVSINRQASRWEPEGSPSDAANGADMSSAAAPQAALNTLLERARKHLVDAKSLVDDLKSIHQPRRRVSRLQQRPPAGEIKNQLRHVRQSINAVLLAHNVPAPAKFAVQLKSIEIANPPDDGLKSVTHPISEKLLGDLRSQLALLRPDYEEQSRRDSTWPETTISSTHPETTKSSIQALSLQVVPRTEDNAKALTAQGHLQKRQGLLDKDSTQGDPTDDGLKYLMAAEDKRMWPSIVSFVATHRRFWCLPDCKCRCHSGPKAEMRFRTPSIINSVIGALFVGYSGYLSKKQACSRKSCFNHGRTTLEIRYTFPGWFLQYAIHAVFQNTMTGKPTFGLQVKRRVPFEPGNILFAARSGDLNSLRQLILRDKECLNDVYHLNGQNALRFAVDRGHVHAVRLLLQAGLDPETEDDWGMSIGARIASVVVYREKARVIRQEYEKLLPLWEFVEDLGLSPIAKVLLGMKPGSLVDMLQEGTPECIQEQLKWHDQGKRYLIHLAVCTDNLTALQALLHAGADVNQLTGFQKTPLIIAITQRRSRELINALFAAGADPFMADADRWTAFHWACSRNNISAVRRIVALGGDVNLRAPLILLTGLHCAAFEDSAEVASYLLENGTDPEYADKDGVTPLFYATAYNSHRTIRALLARRADYLVVPDDGMSILHRIARAADAETIDIFTNHGLRGVDLGHRDKNGFTADDLFRQRNAGSAELKYLFRRLVDNIEVDAKAAERDPEPLSSGEREEDSDDDVFFEVQEN